MRYSLIRSPQFTTFLIVLNVATLSLWSMSRWGYGDLKCGPEENSQYSEAHAQLQLDRQHWQDPVYPETVTVTEVQTTTKIIEPVLPPPTPTPIIFGPAFCDACGPSDEMCKLYGEHNLARSRVYEGSNARFRRVIANAMAGKPTKIAVLGGSVTKGHGLMQNHIENWTAVFLTEWKKLFPNSETILTNGAVPATGTDYYSMCFGEHIEEDADLVIIELAINDQRLESNAISYEWLLRGLLALPNSPAVLNIHTIALSFDQITMGGDLHTPIAEYYDTPIISLRNMLANHIFTNSRLDVHYFCTSNEPDKRPDWRHVNANGHKLMADLLAAYTQRQICAIERDNAQSRLFVDSTDGLLPGVNDLGGIPRLRLFQRYDRNTIVGPVKPFCLSTRTTKHPLVPMDSKGWEPWTYRGRLDKPYLVATEPGSYAKFNVEVGVMGRVRITYLRSKTFGLGDVWCWLDDDRTGGKKVQGWWGHDKINIAVVSVISDAATPGNHVLTCEITQETSEPAGGHEFRLIAVDAS